MIVFLLQLPKVTQTHTHTRTHARTHAHTHTHTHTHKSTSPHTCRSALPCCSAPSIKKWSQGPSGWFNRQTTTGAHGGVAVSALAPLPGNQFVVSGSARGALKVWRADRLSAVEEHKRHSDAITAMCCSDSTLFSASADKTVKVWSVSVPSISDGPPVSRQRSSGTAAAFVSSRGASHDDNDGSGGGFVVGGEGGEEEEEEEEEETLNETRPVTPTMEDVPTIDSSVFSPMTTTPSVKPLSSSPPPSTTALHDALMPMRKQQGQQGQQGQSQESRQQQDAATSPAARQSRFQVDL